MNSTRNLWWAVVLMLLATLLVGPLRRGLWRCAEVPRAMAPPQPYNASDAQHLGTGWAWAAYAASLPPDDPERRAALDRALALDPTDEVTLLRRAAAALGTKGAPAPEAVAAAQAAVTAHPDNAYGHYLLAAALCRQGDLRASLAALRAGNAAPRYDTGLRGTARQMTRLADAVGGSRLALFTAGIASLEELPALRDAARQLANTPDLSAALDVARCGGRVRDQADLLISALVGVAIQAAAMAGPAPEHGAKPPAKETARQRLERVADAFAARLTAAGQTEAAAWVVGECARSIATHQAVATAAGSNWPLAGPLGASLVWTSWAAVLSVGGLLLLLSLLPGRLRRAAPLPWLPGDLALLWAAAIVPALALAALLVRLPYAHLGDGGEAARGWLAALALVPPGLVVALRLGLAGLGLRFARRTSDRVAGLVFVRRSWQTVGSATAALLLLLALASSVPLAYHRATLERTNCLRHERAVLDAARLGR